MFPHGVQRLSPERLNRYLALRDLSDPKQGVHAINVALQKVILAAEIWSGQTAEIHRPSPITTIRDNYDRLYYEEDAVARSTRYTHYVDDERILRTHTSAAIPSILGQDTQYVGSRLIVVPGLVYRRDVMDRMHVGEPHQVDVWITREGRVSRRDLLELIRCMIEQVLPGHEYRCLETYHPYTVNGLEVEVLVGDRWVEVLECGQINPWVLDAAGLDSRHVGGLAMGIGLDRLVMLLKGLDDIRLLRSPEPKIARQMTNLEPYRPVSSQPAVKRDLSVVVSDPDMEVLGDRIRAVLGDRAEWVEEIVEVSRTRPDDLPEHVRARIGIQDHQTNLLIRVVLRAHERSIPREVANTIYNDIYGELHENPEGYWLTSNK